jgi:hypothetical protein
MSSGFPNQPDSLFKRSQIDVATGDRCPGLGEGKGDRSPYASPGSADERGPAGQVHRSAFTA